MADVGGSSPSAPTIKPLVDALRVSSGVSSFSEWPQFGPNSVSEGSKRAATTAASASTFSGDRVPGYQGSRCCASGDPAGRHPDADQIPTGPPDQMLAIGGDGRPTRTQAALPRWTVRADAERRHIARLRPCCRRRGRRRLAVAGGLTFPGERHNVDGALTLGCRFKGAQP
jgi:hypothetical protein